MADESEFTHNGAKRCTATSRMSGERCRSAAIRGGNVCRNHGGAAPQTRRAAALRLQALVDPAIATLGREMVKAEKSSDRQRAANSILDRAGLTRGRSAELDEARALLMEGLLRAKAAIAAGAEPAPAESDLGEVIATVLDDDDAGDGGENVSRETSPPGKKSKKGKKKSA